MNNILEFETLLDINKENKNLKYQILDKTQEFDINLIKQQKKKTFI